MYLSDLPFLFVSFNNVPEDFLSVVTICIVLVFAAHFHLYIHSTQAWIRTKGCQHSTRRETLHDKRMRCKPNYKSHNYSYWKQKCIQIPPPFHIHSYLNGARPGDASVGLWLKRLSLCMCVSKRVTEGRVCTHACTTLFSGLSPLGDWWWEMSNKKVKLSDVLRPRWKTCNSMCLCGCH